MVQKMQKIKNRRGMTMAEVLIVVAIIGVLAGVSFIAVMNYLRSMAQLERDGIAKEIFVAAQNNLTAAKGEGYLGIGGEGGTGYGTPGTLTDDADNDVYYYVVNAGVITGSGDEIFPLMLPFGSIDETVRAGGSYLIRYQRSSGLVLDVFYTTTKASHKRFNHTLKVDEYAALMGVSGSENKSARRTYTDKSVIGWYGGTDAEELATITLQPPVIEVVNAEKLYVNVTDPNAGKEGASLRLIITGTLSGVSHYINVSAGNATDPVQVILDDITTAGGHFAERSFDDMGVSDTTNGFIPGEDIVIKAVAYSTSALANISYSTEKTTNSLYGSVTDSDGDGKPDTAGISNIRHLENLDRTVSKLGANDEAILDTDRKINISAAVQTDDLNWTSFAEAIGTKNVQIHQCGDDTGTKAGCFFPVSPDYLLAYDGQNHSISDIQIDHAGDAGLFGEITEAGSSISNLELKDFSVTGTTSAGALAGSLSGTDVTNVIVRNTENDPAVTEVTASAGSAGGLIGSVTGGELTACGAALTVSGTTAAGGLIGTAAGGAEITACYAAGQTDRGEYYTHKNEDGTTKRDQEIWNVSAGDSGTAGGLVGVAGDAQIAASYSTCSVSGSTAGGFIGTASEDGSINTCYCTGLVSGAGDNAFLGSATAGTPSLTGDNYYFQIINEIITTDDDGNITAITYKEPGLDGVTAIDADAQTYNNFSGSSATWDQAAAYDPELVKYYNGKYNLETVYSLYNQAYNNSLTEEYFAAVHYGDWPAPEIMIENTAQ